MSMLIKSSALDHAVRPFAAAPAVAPSAEAAGPSREEIFELRIAELEAELAANEVELPARLEQARKEGEVGALDMRSDAETRALEALKETLGESLSLWSERLANWNGAAAGIAQAVLEQIFLK